MAWHGSRTTGCTSSSSACAPGSRRSWCRDPRTCARHCRAEVRAWATNGTVATGVDARDLFEAIAREQVRVEFQPLVSLYTGRLVRFEALSRWTPPNPGRVQPR